MDVSLHRVPAAYRPRPARPRWWRGVLPVLLLCLPGVSWSLSPEPLVEIRQILRMDGPGAEVAQSAIEGRAPSTEAGRSGIAKIKAWLKTGKSLDRARVESLLREAAEQGDSEAMVWLGLITAWGALEEAPLQEAAKWYRKAWERGNPAGAYYLAMLYWFGQGMDPDQEESDRLMEQAAKAGYIPARIEWAKTRLGRGDKSGADTLKAFAEAGHPEAMLTLASLYKIGATKGNVIRRSPERYRYWIERAYKAGYGDAGESIGIDYLKGTGGRKKDEAKARTYIKWAQEHGSPDTYMYDADPYWDGKHGVPKDREKAIALMEKAMQEGGVFSAQQLYLRLIYLLGKKVPVDKRRIERALKYAANHGEPMAGRYLGLQYWGGEEGFLKLERDPDQAMKWLRRAMLLGDPPAMAYYYWLLARGKYGAEKDGKVSGWVLADCRMWTHAALSLMRFTGEKEVDPKLYEFTVSIHEFCGRAIDPAMRAAMDWSAQALVRKYQKNPWLLLDAIHHRKAKAGLH